MEAREWARQVDERRRWTDDGTEYKLYRLPGLLSELTQTGRPSLLKVGIPGGSRHHGSGEIPSQPHLDKPCFFFFPFMDLPPMCQQPCLPA